MYRNLHKSVGDSSTGSAPSEAWLFAQAILGKPIPRIVSSEAKARAEREGLARLAQFSSRHADELRRLQAAETEARHDRQILEWAAGISTRAAEKLRALQRKDAEEREVWRQAEQNAELMIEGNWDPSEHPRLGGPPNAGWWATTGTSGQAAGNATTSTKGPSFALLNRTTLSTQDPPVAPSPEPRSRRTIAATTASHTTSKGIPVHFAAAQSGGGHHWVSHVVTGASNQKWMKKLRRYSRRARSHRNCTITRSTPGTA